MPKTRKQHPRPGASETLKAKRMGITLNQLARYRRKGFPPRYREMVIILDRCKAVDGPWYAEDARLTFNTERDRQRFHYLSVTVPARAAARKAKREGVTE